MVPVLRVVGRSGAGKTHVMERLVAELKGRGYSVAAVKHTAHDFEMDVEGKDSWRLSRVGSDTTVLTSPNRLALIRPTERDTTLAGIRKLLGLQFDIALVEGFKQERGPMIEVHRKASGEGLISQVEELMAVVTDWTLDVDVPQYSADDTGGLADLIERTLLRNEESDTIDLYINGNPVPMNIFVRTIFSNILLGMVSSLKRVPEAETVEIALKRTRRS